MTGLLLDCKHLKDSFNPLGFKGQCQAWGRHAITESMMVCYLVPKSCVTLCNPMDCSSPGSSSSCLGFPRQECYSGLPFTSPGDLPDPGIKPMSPVLAGGFFIAEPPAAAAKSLQSCPTLCDPIDGSPPGSPVPGILQARTLEWVAFPSPMHESEK